ncbi:beta-glucosidase [Roseiarcus fermentans]|uniref:Beta-glucosidase n=1 Tax=Roseiarcus fermentans TaxID=1473586 RepID=A0A366EYD9_9HYPH|nr:beta-glucosidase [Roseiarcus fermentans]RBP07412.1 beta-glucosidase [Roseiarcus fermentans]
MTGAVFLRAARALRLGVAGLVGALAALHAAAAPVGPPCGDPSGTADARAGSTLAMLTQGEKLSLVHGVLGAPWSGGQKPEGAIGSAGYVPGVPRLGIPPLQETDGPLGVANPGNVRRGDTATAMPSNVALAATWDLALARGQGEAVGAEARARGFNVLLGGAANLIRDPRGGRTFEYFSEDPWLTGLMAGAVIAGVQSRGVVSTTKHFALNDQETDRGRLDVRIDKAAARESDLLAFEIAIERGRPGAVMCAYNRVEGAHACENPWLLGEVLKGDWGYRGFVLSDWGAVHSTERPAIAGLDQESAEQADTRPFYAVLGDAVAEGRVPQSRLDDMARRILTTMFACGLADANLAAPLASGVAATTARRIADEGAVLLRNDGLLPLAPTLRRVLVVGAHADRGVPSGGGSSQVVPSGGIALKQPEGTNRAMVFMPSSPLAALRRRLPSAAVDFDDGLDADRAARKAARADAVVVFADQYMTEGADVADLALPSRQDRLIGRIAEANPKTVVVLETGGPVLMPWLDRTAAVLEAWYPGQAGGEAIADILTGAIDPSGRLPVTFPASEAQLPRRKIELVPPEGRVPDGAPIVARYDEGASTGYRSFARRGERPLFPFGFGLSYTTFRLGALAAHADGSSVTAELAVTNAGARAGAAVAQLYVAGPEDSGVGLRLAGWARLDLAPGETKRATIAVDPRLIATFDEGARRWRIAGGVYTVSAGFDAAARDATADVAVEAADAPP